MCQILTLIPRQESSITKPSLQVVLLDIYCIFTNSNLSGLVLLLVLQEEKLEQQLVVFELAGEYYGVDIGSVEGIIKVQDIKRLPKTPHFVEGVTNLRGSVIPVIDLRKRFGIESVPYDKDTRIVVVIQDRLRMGIVVDGVSEVLRIPDTAIEPAPTFVASMDTRFITGIAKVDDRLITLLDLVMILSVEEQNIISTI
jgi:purine-binding chemotaxis protein CheW